MARPHRPRRRATLRGRAALAAATLATVAIGITVGATQAGSTPSKPADTSPGLAVRTEVDGGDGANGATRPLDTRPTLGNFHFTVRVTCIMTGCSAPTEGTVKVQLRKESGSDVVFEADGLPLTAYGTDAESAVDFFQLPNSNSIAAGDYKIVAHFTPDARHYYDETQATTQHVSFQPRAAEATTVTVDGPQYGSIQFGQPVPIQATVAGASGSAAPTGTVTAEITKDADNTTVFTTPAIALSPATGANGKSATPKFDLDKYYQDGNGGNDIPFGFYHVAFTYHPADGTFAQSNASFPLEVALLNNTWRLTDVPAQLAVNESATVTVTFDDRTKGTPGPTGFVQMVEGSTPIGDQQPVQKDADGHLFAKLPLRFASAGMHRDIKGLYLGDKNYNKAYAYVGATQADVRVYGTASHITLTTPHNPTDVTQLVPLVATITVDGEPNAAPTGEVEFEVTNPRGTSKFYLNLTAQNAGTVTVPGDDPDARSYGVGDSKITARFVPDRDDLSSPENTIVLTVTKAATTVTLTSNNDKPLPGQSVEYSAATSGPNGKPTGTIVFHLDNGPPVDVDVKDGVATWTAKSLAAGNHVVYAEYSGDDTYASSVTSVKVTVTAATTPPPTHPTSAPGHPSAPTHPSSTPAHPNGGGSGGGLASTGSPIGQLSIWAAMLLVGGAGLILVGGRRRRA